MNLRKIKKFDWMLIASIMFLLGLGMLAIFSASAGKPDGQLSLVFRQIAAGFIGISLFFIFSFLDYRALKRASLPLYFINIALLIAVLFFGKEINGAKSWFRLGVINFQPVEFSKVVMIAVLAGFFSRHFRRLNQFRYVLVSLVITLVPIFLILLQPDPGSAFVIFSIWAGLILVAGIKKAHMLILAFAALAGGIFGWKFILKDYQKARITSFINPYSDPRGRGYNAIQSIIAVGSGGIFGKGIGNGSQGRLNFLPERHTDFIFANIAEELGFLGVALLLAGYAVLLSRQIIIAAMSHDNFSRFLVIGAALLIFTHIVENAGMNIGLMPITGIPLPLLSYGGSSLIFMLVSLGVSHSVAVNKIDPIYPLE